MPQMRLLVAVEPVDLRKGIDGLAAVCRQRLQTDPMSGAVFVFGSRNRKSIKILVYDGQGFFLQDAIRRGLPRGLPLATFVVMLIDDLRSQAGNLNRMG